MIFIRFIFLFFLFSVQTTFGSRNVYLLDYGWKFELENSSPKQCSNLNSTFPFDMNNKQCLGLSQVSSISNANQCADACCGSASCEVFQWCNESSCSNSGCWIGSMSNCVEGVGWISRGRKQTPGPPPGSYCSDPHCDPKVDDSAWRALDLPHDFVVEGTFNVTADKSHGYLPYGVGWYRKHMEFPPLETTDVAWIDFEGIQSESTVWLNGVLLGTHSSGYTPSRYYLNASFLSPNDNVLVVKADATKPDGWWYDGGGIYRHVWLTVIHTSGPYLKPWGIYIPSNVVGDISWVNNKPFGNADISLFVDVVNPTNFTKSINLQCAITDSSGTVVESFAGSASLSPKTTITWNSTRRISNAALWHLVDPPAKASLYVVHVSISVGNQVVDEMQERFGIRRTSWNASTGFFMNDRAIKILGNANHQDFAGLGVAIPDHLQEYRLQKLKDMGANGWRTAHNPPNTALLDAADELGVLVWDENHRNGQDSECELLILRDRNHPSIVIWSICNEVLCETSNWVADALRLKSLIKQLDPLGNRPISANQNGWIGTSTPLDVQGFDYSTNTYDMWHSQAPNIPSISSETSSAVSDRGEYVNDEAGGHVSGYDVNYPGWGQSAQQAWGGIGEPNNQGILTRSFISGGWTWTGWDYKGEPTPYSWPNINSHFGILDICGFEKDRFYWYAAWFKERQQETPVLHIFPHWNWKVGDKVNVWAYTNVDEVELFINGVSQGKQLSPQYGHVEWGNVNYQPGNIMVLGYIGGKPVSKVITQTTGEASGLRISVRDNVGSTLLVGCADVLLIQVAVVDNEGLVVPTASNVVTIVVDGPATFLGGGNGDPACHTNDKSNVRPAFHGLVLGVIQGGDVEGKVRITANSPGMLPVHLEVSLISRNEEQKSINWCRSEKRL